MAKPKEIGGYSSAVTEDCERVLVTLLRGLGPWKTSVFLLGGLVPRYLVKAKPPEVRPHAGTADIDIVVDLSILTEVEAYQTIEENLKKMGFERAENGNGNKVSWRWKVKTETGTTMIVEFLADDPSQRGGHLQELPTKGDVSAINIPHASMVFDHHQTLEVTAELLGEGGKSTEVIAFADIVSFVTLKSLAFDQRNERKDAHDLIYCIEHGEGGPVSAGAEVASALGGKHGEIIRSSLNILRRRFTDDKNGQGYEKDGPVAVSSFEIEAADEDGKEARVLRQRQVSEIVVSFLKAIDEASTGKEPR